jgi:CHAT domain
MSDADEDSQARSERVRAEIDAAARKTGVKSVNIVMADEAYVVFLAGPPGAVFINASSADFFDQLEREGLFDPARSQEILAHAHAAATRGVELRTEGRLAAAYMHQRWALFVAVRLGERPGIDATTANVWVIRQAIQDITIRALGPARNPNATADERRAMAAYDNSLRWAEGAIAADAAELAPLVRTGIADSTLMDGTAPDWLAVHRLARMGGDVPLRREALARLQPLTVGGENELLLAAVEDLAELDLEGMLRAVDGTPAEANTAPSTLELYLRVRAEIIGASDLDRLSNRLRTAFEHLGFLRMAATTAGGAFGHRLSYAISTFLQVVGRDLASVLLRQNAVEAALACAESLLARSMADWMCRTHGIWRVSARYRAAINPLVGSLNAVEAANLDDVRGAAADAGAIVYYLSQPDGHVAWLVRRDGRIVFARLNDVPSRLSAVLSYFPFLGGAETSRHIGVPSQMAGRAADSQAALGALHDVLFPLEIRDALVDQGEKLVIIADPSLNTVPFCALWRSTGHFLVEEHEIELWPSVTSRLVLENSARLPSWQRGRRSAPVPPLVVGIGEFGSDVHEVGQRVDPSPPPLPGAVEEANAIASMLGATAILDERATRQRLFQKGQGATIIHLATHAFLDEVSPEYSYLQLSDGRITAGMLYQFDRGLRCDLIVMSACRTGLGGANPDSMIGLANAFLIAGAQCVVSTLWTIPDRATAAIMGSFYRHMLEGGTVAYGLRQAQREALARPATSDPYYWAALRVTGRTNSPLPHRT